VQKLAVEPKEENQAYTTFIIPRERESKLPVILFSSVLLEISLFQLDSNQEDCKAFTSFVLCQFG
jgi:fumarate reductase subunit C